MRAYVATTGLVFALVVVAHLLRVAEEGAHVAAQPLFIIATAIPAGLTVWAVLVLRRLPR
jgi:hypothetical protein